MKTYKQSSFHIIFLLTRHFHADDLTVSFRNCRFSFRHMRASETSYKDIKVRLKQRLEYVSQDIPMMMRELLRDSFPIFLLTRQFHTRIRQFRDIA